MTNFIEPDSTRNFLSIKGTSPKLLHWIENLIESDGINNEPLRRQLEFKLESLFSEVGMASTVPDSIGEFFILFGTENLSSLDTKKLIKEREQYHWGLFLKSIEFKKYNEAIYAMKWPFENATKIKEKSGGHFIDALKSLDLTDRIIIYQVFRFTDEAIAELEGITYTIGFRPEFLILNDIQPGILETLLRFSREEMEAVEYCKIPHCTPDDDFHAHWIFLPYISKRNVAVLDHIYEGTDLLSIIKDTNSFFEEAYTDPAKWLYSSLYRKRRKHYQVDSIILPDIINRVVLGHEEEIFTVFKDFLTNRIDIAETLQIINLVIFFLLPNKIEGSQIYFIGERYCSKILMGKELIDTMTKKILEIKTIEHIINILRKSNAVICSPANGANDFTNMLLKNIVMKLANMYDIPSFLSALPIIRFYELQINQLNLAYSDFLDLFRGELRGLNIVLRSVLTHDSLTEEDAVRLFTLDAIDLDDPVDFMKHWQAFIIEQLCFINDVRDGSEEIYDSNMYKLLSGLYTWKIMPDICSILRSGQRYQIVEWKRSESILAATVEKSFTQKPFPNVDESAILIASALIVSGSEKMDLLLDSQNVDSVLNANRQILFLKILKEIRNNPNHDWSDLAGILKSTGLLYEIPNDIIHELPIDHDDYIDNSFENYLIKSDEKSLSTIISLFLSAYSNTIAEKESYFILPDGKTLTERGNTFFIRQIEKRLSEERQYERFSNLHIVITLAHRWKLNDRNAASKQLDLFARVTANARNLLNTIRASVRFGDRLDFPEAAYDCVWPAVELIALSSSHWKALKQLLLIFRHLKEPSLSDSLKPDGEKDATEISAVFEYILQKIHDEDLYRQCRLDMVHDLAEFLKPIKGENLNAERIVDGESGNEPGFDPSRKEPDPLWRYAYVRAIGDLGVDPSQKGHYYHGILKKVSETDPSEDVRNAAMKVVKELGEYHDGWKSGSHKRLLFHAWWWIKQAHMLSTGGTINGEEALKTRNTEFR